MAKGRPMVMSIAGLDPSGGAGLLADVKTFEQHKVYGLGVATAQTLQTAEDFMSVGWEKEDDILKAVETMLDHFPVMAVKIGIVENMAVLNAIVSLIHQKDSAVKIVVDTVFRSSSGFNFWNEAINDELLEGIFSRTCLITPNYIEVLQLKPLQDEKKAAASLSAYCSVLLKGGHNKKEMGVDYLFMKDSVQRLEGGNTALFPKHGSGCVLSAAITANIALGFNLMDACKNAKTYIEQFLLSNQTLLGYHYV